MLVQDGRRRAADNRRGAALLKHRVLVLRRIVYALALAAALSFTASCTRPPAEPPADGAAAQMHAPGDIVSVGTKEYRLISTFDSARGREGMEHMRVTVRMVDYGDPPVDIFDFELTARGADGSPRVQSTESDVAGQSQGGTGRPSDWDAERWNTRAEDPTAWAMWDHVFTVYQDEQDLVVTLSHPSEADVEWRVR